MSVIFTHDICCTRHLLKTTNICHVHLPIGVDRHTFSHSNGFSCHPTRSLTTPPPMDVFTSIIRPSTCSSITRIIARVHPDPQSGEFTRLAVLRLFLHNRRAPGTSRQQTPSYDPTVLLSPTEPTIPRGAHPANVKIKVNGGTKSNWISSA